MEYRLKEILQDKGYIRGPFGSSLKRNELKSTGIPVYEQQHAIYATREFRYYIDEKKYSQMKRFAVKPNDLIISCSGTIGKVDLISENDPIGIISQALLILRANADIVLPEYLFYFFKSDYGYNSIISRSMGSVQVNIAKREVIENIKINIPSLKEQEKIVNILSNIDGKIKLNNQINNNIQNFIFKQYQNISKKINARVKLNEITNISSGKRPKIKADNLDIPIIGASGIMSYTNGSNYNKDIIIIGRVGTLGMVQRYNYPIWASDNTITIDTKYRNYIENYLKTIDYTVLNRGSTQPLLTQTDIGKQKIKFDEDIIKKFENSTQVFKENIWNNINENTKLEQLKDTLLPKLMNGEIDLDKIEI